MKSYQKILICVYAHKKDLKALREIIREEVETESENLKTGINGTLSMSGIKVRSEIKEVGDRLKNIERHLHLENVGFA